MDSREIVLRAIEFRNPPRLPVNYCNRDFEHSDVLANGAAADPAFAPTEPGQTEWGYAWGSLDETMGQPRTHPLADPAAIAGYRRPVGSHPARYAHLPGWIAENRSRFLRASVGISGFNQATFLRGFEAFLEDLTLEPRRAAAVLDFVFDFENELIAEYCKLDVDCVVFGDDWGSQNGLLISPARWRSVFKPRYAEQFATIRAAGKKVWFHCCGNIRAVIGDFIDIGVDVLELLQPDIFGVEWLGREFGGKVCFCCSVDHQRRAVQGSREEIRAYVAHLQEQLGRFGGGLIGYVEDYHSLGMTEANYQWIRQAFHGLEHGAAPDGAP